MYKPQGGQSHLLGWSSIQPPCAVSICVAKRGCACAAQAFVERYWNVVNIGLLYFI